jgi:hypothetical protein
MDINERATLYGLAAVLAVGVGNGDSILEPALAVIEDQLGTQNSPDRVVLPSEGILRGGEPKFLHFIKDIRDLNKLGLREAKEIADRLYPEEVRQALSNYYVGDTAKASRAIEVKFSGLQEKYLYKFSPNHFVNILYALIVHATDATAGEMTHYSVDQQIKRTLKLLGDLNILDKDDLGEIEFRLTPFMEDPKV